MDGKNQDLAIEEIPVSEEERQVAVVASNPLLVDFPNTERDDDEEESTPKHTGEASDGWTWH
jgi:hypothetical protein